jgi:hypothetical protein
VTGADFRKELGRNSRATRASGTEAGWSGTGTRSLDRSAIATATAPGVGRGTLARMTDLADQVKADGWLIATTSSMEEFEALVRALGRPRRARGDRAPFDELSVVRQSEAYPHSHSARYGEGAFPLHTDTAHWTVPARFLVIRSGSLSARPTWVLDLGAQLFHYDFRSLLAESVFTVVNGRHSFLSAAWNGQQKLLRYDPTCMRPATRTAARAADVFRSLSTSAERRPVYWSPGKTLVVDNWRCLHGRGEVDGAEASVRVLTRALVEDTWH